MRNEIINDKVKVKSIIRINKLKTKAQLEVDVRGRWDREKVWRSESSISLINLKLKPNNMYHVSNYEGKILDNQYKI